MAALAPYAGHAHVVGLTGSPGVGKSTATSALVKELRAEGKRVGVLAVDPRVAQEHVERWFHGAHSREPGIPGMARGGNSG